MLLFQYLPATFSFSAISSQSFGLRPLLRYFLSLWSQRGVISLKPLFDTFCPLQQHSKPMHTAAGIWPDCRLETNPLRWRQTFGRCWEVTFHSDRFQCSRWHNPLNAELNPICHLLALLEAHHILHVSRIKVNSNVVIYFLVWSLSRLLCCVGSVSNIAAALVGVSPDGGPGFVSDRVKRLFSSEIRRYVACSKTIRPLAGKNTFTRTEVCYPNRSSLLVTEHTSPSSSAIVRSISGMPLCEWSTAWPSCSV